MMAPGPRVTLVVTPGRGSMDRYGERLAERLPLDVMRVDLHDASAGAWGVSALTLRALRDRGGDARVVASLRAAPGVPHLTNHHLARYGPLLGRPYLVTAHDLIRWHDLRRRAGYISRPGLRDRGWIRRDHAGIGGASGVIAPSEHTRRELVEELGVPGSRVCVVPMGVDHGAFHPVGRRVVGGLYVLFVGSEHPRKNLAGLLRAFALLKRGGANPGLRLVKVGEPGSAEARYRRATAALVGELGLGADVVFTGWVPDEDLRALYSGAVCTVLPSLAEGFGLPPLEAMACGCPVVVSNAGALPEIAGGAAVVVDPGDVEELARALHALAGDAAARAELSALGLARAARFSWGRTAAETAHAYDTLLRSTPRPAAAA